MANDAANAQARKKRKLTDPVIAGIFILVGALIALGGTWLQSDLNSSSTAKQNLDDFLRQQRITAYSTILTDASVYLNDIGPLLKKPSTDQEQI